MAEYRLLESRDLSQAAGFLRACLSRAQHRTAGVEAAARGDVGRIWRLACQNLMGPATTDLRSYGEQGFRIGMQGLGEHRLRRPKLDDLAQIHDCDPVGKRPGEGEVVGDEDQGHPDLVLEPHEELEDLTSHRGVEHGYGLVGDEHPRLERYRGRDDHPLALPPRELVRVAEEGALGWSQAGPRQGMGHDLLLVPL